MPYLHGLVPFLLADTSTPPSIGWGMIFYLAIVLAVIIGFSIAMQKGLKDRVFTNPITALSEQAYLFVENMCVMIIGDNRGRRYIPMILTIWLVIFVSNILGLVLPHNPTGDWSFNLGMAILVVMYVQWEGAKVVYEHDVEHGMAKPLALLLAFPKYMKHFWGPPLGGPMVLINVLLFVIEIVSEALRMLTLSLRLYGNIHGGHLVRDSLDHMFPPLHIGSATIPIPIGMLVLPLELFAAIIQALVFTILGVVYVALVVRHEEQEEGREHAQPVPAAAAA